MTPPMLRLLTLYAGQGDFMLKGRPKRNGLSYPLEMFYTGSRFSPRVRPQQKGLELLPPAGGLNGFRHQGEIRC